MEYTSLGCVSCGERDIDGWNYYRSFERAKSNKYTDVNFVYVCQYGDVHQERYNF
jgi:hypothetical protein